MSSLNLFFQTIGIHLNRFRRHMGQHPDLYGAMFIFGVSLVLLLLTATQGYVRDEGYYFKAARDYHAWFERWWEVLKQGRPFAAFAAEEIDRAFHYNTEHPALLKILMGWTWKIFHHCLGWVNSATGFRLAAILIVSIGNSFIFLLGTKWHSRRVGLLAVVLYMSCPRVFYHAHLACFDAPVTALSIICVYTFYLSFFRFRYVWLCGIFWGLAIAIKHNAVFLWPTFLIAYLLSQSSQFFVRQNYTIRIPRIPLSLVLMLVIGPLVFYVCYPWGWHDPFSRIADYYYYHLHHEHYSVEYLGMLLNEPPFPWSFPWLMSSVTIPFVVLASGITGSLYWLYLLGRISYLSFRTRTSISPEQMLPWFLIINLIIPPLIISIPSVPIFGGTKHWLPMMPFFCLMGAWTISQGTIYLQNARYIRNPVWKIMGVILLLVTTLAFPLYETIRTHPFGHTYYNELIGGHQGGAALGLARTFWGGDARTLLPVLNEKADQGATVFTDRMNYYGFEMYQIDGLLRKDLRWTHQLRKADWAFINHQREYQNLLFRIWSLTGTQKPIAQITFDHVPIVSLYQLSP